MDFFTLSAAFTVEEFLVRCLNKKGVSNSEGKEKKKNGNKVIRDSLEM